MQTELYRTHSKPQLVTTDPSARVSPKGIDFNKSHNPARILLFNSGTEYLKVNLFHGETCIMG